MNAISTNPDQQPVYKPSQTRKVNTDVVRIMLELSEMMRASNAALDDKSMMEKVADRIREERMVERAMIVSYLTLALPDTAETRTALEYVFGGSHRRMSAAVLGGGDSGVPA
jgi:hypothetical protein